MTIHILSDRRPPISTSPGRPCRYSCAAGSFNAQLNREINAGLADAGVKMRFAAFGATVFAGSPSDFAKLIAEDTDKWAKVIRARNIRAE